MMPCLTAILMPHNLLSSGPKDSSFVQHSKTLTSIKNIGKKIFVRPKNCKLTTERARF